MLLTNPAIEKSSVALSSSAPILDLQPTMEVTLEEVRTMILYLRKAQARAIEIRDRSPAGSYMVSVLDRTIDGITLEISQLDYLLARKPVDTEKVASKRHRMRPAI
jgi:hypothetical protein